MIDLANQYNIPINEISTKQLISIVQTDFHQGIGAKVSPYVFIEQRELLNKIKSKIFIPFFTTKDSGSGIGLSLSRQILQLHGGSISMHSNNKNETVFSLNFK